MNSNNYRLFKVRPSLHEVLGTFRQLYTPESAVVFDESVIPFRVRLNFKQYLASLTNTHGKFTSSAVLSLIPGPFRPMLGSEIRFFHLVMRIQNPWTINKFSWLCSNYLWWKLLSVSATCSAYSGAKIILLWQPKKKKTGNLFRKILLKLNWKADNWYPNKTFSKRSLQ